MALIDLFILKISIYDFHVIFFMFRRKKINNKKNELDKSHRGDESWSSDKTSTSASSLYQYPQTTTSLQGHELPEEIVSLEEDKTQPETPVDSWFKERLDVVSRRLKKKDTSSIDLSDIWDQLLPGPEEEKDKEEFADDLMMNLDLLKERLLKLEMDNQLLMKENRFLKNELDHSLSVLNGMESMYLKDEEILINELERVRKEHKQLKCQVKEYQKRMGYPMTQEPG
jgi:tRNA splicing endonuclease